MSNLIPFQFENSSIRVVAIGDTPWFVAKDVCSILMYANPSDAVKSHCKRPRQAKDLGIAFSYYKNQELAVGLHSETVLIPESDVYRLVIRSRLSEAQRFENWVFEEVLPSIRKTGKYESNPSATPAEAAALVLKSVFEVVSMVPGVKPGIAAAQYLTAVQQSTGVSTEPFRLALPPQEEPANLNPTNLGKLVGMSAREVNLELALRGLQIKNERGEWELTDQGREYAEAYPFARNGHASYQILWQPKTQGLLA